MASKLEFVEYVCEQCQQAGVITYKKMFGEFAIYCDGKIIGNICDDQFFLKPVEAVRPYIKEVIEMPPYTGAKPYFLIDDLDDVQYFSALVKRTYEALPAKK